MADFDPNAVATKGDLVEVTAQLRAEFQSGFDDLKEAIRDSQTELLNAFYSFAQTADVKFKDRETSDMGLRQRLMAVESRLTEIEKRLNLPPAA